VHQVYRMADTTAFMGIKLQGGGDFSDNFSFPLARLDNLANRFFITWRMRNRVVSRRYDISRVDGIEAHVTFADANKIAVDLEGFTGMARSPR
jgi:hypothetical protein